MFIALMYRLREILNLKNDSLESGSTIENDFCPKCRLANLLIRMNYLFPEIVSKPSRERAALRALCIRHDTERARG